MEVHKQKTMNGKYEERTCIIIGCNNKFFVPIGSKKKNNIKKLRSRRCFTCSKECSKIKLRHRTLYQKIIRELKNGN